MKTRTRLGENLVRKLSKIGGFSYGVTLPIDIIRKFKWRERQKLQLTVDEKKKRIIIEDWEKQTMGNNYKLVVTVPVENADAVRDAIAEAGGGVVGNYSHCSFSTRGIGRFKPESGANPHIGEIGKIESVEEERIEVTVNKDGIKSVIDTLKKAHPYEEVMYDLYSLESYE